MIKITPLITGIILFVGVIIIFTIKMAVSDDSKKTNDWWSQVDHRVDNNGYYLKMAEKGLYLLQPEVEVLPARYTGDQLMANSVRTLNSPDIRVTEINSTQSENSIFVDPADPFTVLQSNNSTQNPVGSLYGANDLYTFDGSETWEGKVQGAGGNNSGDPTTAIGYNGRWYINYIFNGGQGISYSDDQGESWTRVVVSPSPGNLADKNHMWIDNGPNSPYQGNLYVAWTDFGGPYDGNVVISRSTDNGESWSSRQPISTGQPFSQGVHIQTGPNGEVYCFFAIYAVGSLDEDAIGMARSLDGGETWDPAVRIINNIRGIRSTGVGKNHRVNSFPVGAVDITDGVYSGNIYVTWTNIGVPGINSGTDADVYIIRSTDQGDSWSEPIRVNQDPSGMGRKHYFPWITCDPETGGVHLVFYDDRNVGGAEVETFCANSSDAGETWEDFKVSDVAFTPAPIGGLAGGYMGDYLGITAKNGNVYPVWADNREGFVMTYCSPYAVLASPADLTAVLTFETGAVDLEWTFEGDEGFETFNVYRDGDLIGQTTNLVFQDELPDFGLYNYELRAAYAGGLESNPATAAVQWGDAHINTEPQGFTFTLPQDQTDGALLSYENTGELDLSYTASALINSFEYCEASGGGGQYINKVILGGVEFESGNEGYLDRTQSGLEMNPGDIQQVFVETINPDFTTRVFMWVDWNNNGLFDEDDLNVQQFGSGVFFAIIQVPEEAKAGQLRFRIRLATETSLEPCGITDSGETEDYSIFTGGWLQLSPQSGTVAPGETGFSNISVNSSGLDIGVYEGRIRINSNDPDNLQQDLPVSLRVSNLLVEIISSADEVCAGSEITLSANVQGAGDEITYLWSSDPAGFESTEASPSVSFDMTTTVFLTVSSGADQRSAQKQILVNDLPEVFIGNDTSICSEASIDLDATTPNASAYLWSNGETNAMITITGDGTITTEPFSVTVTDNNTCTASDTLELEFKDCTSLPELDESLVSVYPNPASDRLQLTGDLTWKSIKIFSQEGEELVFMPLENVNKTLDIDISNLASGIYIIFVESDQGFLSKKLVVSKAN